MPGPFSVTEGVGLEPDTSGIIERCISQGRRVALPRVLGNGLMEARLIGSLSQLEPGAYGIPEPPESALKSAS